MRVMKRNETCMPQPWPPPHTARRPAAVTPVCRIHPHLADGVGVADVGEELVAHALALAGALDQARDVHKLHGGGDLMGGSRTWGGGHVEGGKSAGQESETRQPC